MTSKNMDNLPLFQKLHVQLAEIIEMTPPGERLMSEPELAESLGVSRATLREAMRSFEGQGLIRRRQGVGTFVLDHKQNIQTGLETLESIETLANSLGLEVRMGHLNVSQTCATHKLAEKMGVEIGSPIVQICRVIWVADRPVAYLIDVLPEGILSKEDLANGFTGSVLDMLIRRGDPELSYSDTYITACSAETEIAKKLQLQRGDVLQKFEAWLYDSHRNMIDYSETYFVPGFFKFRVNRKIAVS